MDFTLNKKDLDLYLENILNIKIDNIEKRGIDKLITRL